jgi:hypothetical protein
MKIVVLSPFNVIPPNFGGAERIFNLATRLGEATLIALNWQGIDQEGTLGKMKYRLISAEPEAYEQAQKLLKLGLHTWDGIPALAKNKLKKLRSAIEEENADRIVLEHPWLMPFVGNTPFIYDSHNAEHYLTYSRWPNSYDEQIVKQLEGQALRLAQKITTCSEVDAYLMQKAYGLDKPMVYIPNGTDLPAKTSEGKTKNLLFIGSFYGPNIKGAQLLANLAPQLPDYTIQILGGCVQGVKADSPNVQLIGAVTEEEKDKYFQEGYAFINLVSHGSGTALKNGRATAYGLPVIATKVGGRGYPTAIITEPEGVPTALAQLDWRKEKEKNLAYAQSISWDTVGEKFREVVLA